MRVPVLPLQPSRGEFQFFLSPFLFFIFLHFPLRFHFIPPSPIAELHCTFACCSRWVHLVHPILWFFCCLFPGILMLGFLQFVYLDFFAVLALHFLPSISHFFLHLLLCYWGDDSHSILLLVLHGNARPQFAGDGRNQLFCLQAT